MESALNGLAAQAKTSTLRETVAMAREALANMKTKGDTPVVYVREKLLSAFELGLEVGSEKAQQHSIEGIQCLIRDRRFHSSQQENPEDGLPAQLLNSLNAIAHFGHQVQCHCLTVIVELICSVELKITVLELQTALELCMRAFGASREESARMSARAAISQSIASYCSNRYNRCETPQDYLTVYLDATALLEGYVAKLDSLSIGSEQSLVLFDATNALLSAQPLSIEAHRPFVNLLWEKLCPLMIRLLGVPDRARGSPIPPDRSSSTGSTDTEPLGQGQIARFALSPAAMANPEATRALYLIVEQLMRLMCGHADLHSMLEALVHKALLFPVVEHRLEAVRLCRKMLGDPRRLADIIRAATERGGDLSLWRMAVVCLQESADPNGPLALDAVRACAHMLQGLIELCDRDVLAEQSRRWLVDNFGTLQQVKAQGFLPRQSSDGPAPASLELRTETVDAEEPDTDVSDCLQRLSSRLTGSQAENGGGEGASTAAARIRRETRESRASNSVLEAGEAATAARFVTALLDTVPTWEEKGTLAQDERLLHFATTFHADFSAAHADLFKRKCLVQHEFLNTDALYLTIYATLSLLHRGAEVVTWPLFRDWVLGTGCEVYASETWLKQVYDLASSRQSPEMPTIIVDLIKDFDGFDRGLLSEVARLKRIQNGPPVDEGHREEKMAARWLLCSSWESIVCILNTFLGMKEKRSRLRHRLLEGLEHSISGMQRLATVSMRLGLGERCGWIFEGLVEASCDVDSLRAAACQEEFKRLSVVSRTDLLSMQLVLDNAFVANEAPECWKHVIRCTEYVWELEKFIYGALCYDKPTPGRGLFGWRKEEEKEQPKEQEGLAAAERSVESVLGSGDLDRDGLNKALAVLIAKTDAFYGRVGKELSLSALRHLLTALVSASLARTLYPSMAQTHSPSLTSSSSLISRLWEVCSSLPSRPLIHQMTIVPLAARHLIEVACGSEEDSRASVSALSECARSLVCQEGVGQSFNQTLLQPFQAIVCSDRCSTETRAQLVDTLSEFVHKKADRLGSGWKPLFGALRAVRTSDGAEEGLHWTVLDVISTYLRLNKCAVLSWSLPDCLPCIVHFLQETTPVEKEEGEKPSKEEQLSAAALKLITPCYSVIRTLYTTPHLPNHNLLHKMQLRAQSSEEVEVSEGCFSSSLPPASSTLDPSLFPLRPDDPSPADLEKTLLVPMGVRPWEEAEAHRLAAVELLLELVEQLAGVLITAAASVQAQLLSALQELISTIRQSEIGPAPAAFCVASLILPHIQKWMRRSGSSRDAAVQRNMRHAIGICAQIAVDFIQLNPGGAWELRLLSDTLRLATECAAQPSGASRVGVACLRHFDTVLEQFEFAQWTIMAKALWDTCCVTLAPLRLLLSTFLPDGNDDGGDIGHVLIEGTGPLSHNMRMLAERIFLVDAQRDPTARLSVCDDEPSTEPTMIIDREGKRERLPLSQLLHSLQAHHALLQFVVQLLCPAGEPPEELAGIVSSSSPSGKALMEEMGGHIRASLLHCLDLSFQIARDLDERPGARTMIGRLLRLREANLCGQMTIAGAGKMNCLMGMGIARMREGEQATLEHLGRLLSALMTQLERLERVTVRQRIAAETREHREEKFVFMLVENADFEEKAYRLVGEDQMDETLNEYKKQRPIGIQPKRIDARKNPFVAAINAERQSAELEEAPPLCLLRLVAWRTVICLPLKGYLKLSQTDRPLFDKALPLILPSLKSLLVATPDLAVRRLALSYIELLAEK